MMKKFLKVLACVIPLASPSISYGLSAEEKKTFDEMSESTRGVLSKFFEYESKCGFLYLSAVGLAHNTTKSQLEQMSNVIPYENKEYGKSAIHMILGKLSYDEYNLGFKPALTIYKKAQIESIIMLRSEAQARLLYEKCPTSYINSVKRFNEETFSEQKKRWGDPYDR